MDLATLFLWSFLAATILPLGLEPALAAIVHRRDAVALPVTVATLSNYLGACTTYALAMIFSRAVKSERALRRMERASALARRYGAPALLLSWVPLLGDGIGGAARMHFLALSLCTIAGKAGRLQRLEHSMKFEMGGSLLASVIVVPAAVAPRPGRSTSSEEKMTPVPVQIQPASAPAPAPASGPTPERPKIRFHEMDSDGDARSCANPGTSLRKLWQSSTRSNDALPSGRVWGSQTRPRTSPGVR